MNGRRFAGETQSVQQRQNEVSKLIPKEKDAARKQELIAEGKTLRERAGVLEKQQKQAQEELHAALLTIPNMTHPDAPVGKEATDNKVIRRWGEPRKFDFAPNDHVALMEALDLVDFEAGASVAGQKFYYLKNEAALLELALVQYAMQTLVKEGYTPVVTPDVARVEVLEGVGFLPRDPDPEKRQIYSLADTDLCLIATAEITLGGMHRDRIFDELDLPKKYVGLSHCFRTEAGAPGRDTPASTASISSPRSKCLFSARPTKVKTSISNCCALRKASFKGWACPITSSTLAPATLAVRRIANTIWRRGCRAAATTANTAK